MVVTLGILLLESVATISVSEVPSYFVSVLGILVFELPVLSFPILYMYLEFCKNSNISLYFSFSCDEPACKRKYLLNYKAKT